jgi:hypothetical protein
LKGRAVDRHHTAHQITVGFIHADSGPPSTAAASVLARYEAGAIYPGY